MPPAGTTTPRPHSAHLIHTSPGGMAPADRSQLAVLRLRAGRRNRPAPLRAPRPVPAHPPQCRVCGLLDGRGGRTPRHLLLERGAARYTPHLVTAFAAALASSEPVLRARVRSLPRTSSTQTPCEPHEDPRLTARPGPSPLGLPGTRRRPPPAERTADPAGLDSRTSTITPPESALPFPTRLPSHAFPWVPEFSPALCSRCPHAEFSRRSITQFSRIPAGNPRRYTPISTASNGKSLDRPEYQFSGFLRATSATTPSTPTTGSRPCLSTSSTRTGNRA